MNDEWKYDEYFYIDIRKEDDEVFRMSMTTENSYVSSYGKMIGPNEAVACDEKNDKFCEFNIKFNENEIIVTVVKQRNTDFATGEVFVYKNQK